MLTDPELRSPVDPIWERLRSSGLWQVTMERLLKLEHIMGIEVRELMSFIDK